MDRLLRRLLHPLNRRLETTVHPLRYLFVEITQRCNLRCLHCGSDCGAKPRLDELTTDEWLRFFDYLAGHADTSRMVLVITGGEPLCHPELDRILEGLRGAGLAWGMVTNGHALSRPRIDQLMRAGLSSITVSLDGLEGSHDWLRGVAGAHARVTESLRHLVRAQVPFFDVVTCVNPRNLEELPRLGEELRAMGVPAWRLFCIFPRGRARGNAQLLLSPGQFRQLLEFIAARRVGTEGPRTSFSCEGYLPWRLDGRVRDEPYFCRAGISIGSVLCDGAISACPNIPRTLVQGNIRDDDLLQVWDRRFQAFRQRTWMKQGPCRQCSEWGRCLGNSMHLWDEQAGQTACCTFGMAQGATCGGPMERE